MNQKEILPILTLQQIKGIGLKSIEKILKIFTNFEPDEPSDLFDRLKAAHEIDEKIKIPEDISVQIVEECWEESKKIIEISKKNDIKIISKKSPQYPKYLLKIPDPPVLLHFKGNINSLSQENIIAIVGTRKPTPYGISNAGNLGKLFAKEGFVVVSGLAAGIDTQAHKGALDVEGITAAVLAHGLHTVYPPENKELADEILEKNGAVISEYCWGKNSFPGYFVERDRIQSGLSLGVFVVETGIKGGTMHTVRFCKEQNRALIVFKPTIESVDFPETQGNSKLISNKTADITFENDGNLDSVRKKLNSIREDLLINQDEDKFSESAGDFKQEKTKINADNKMLLTCEKDKDKPTTQSRL